MNLIKICLMLLAGVLFIAACDQAATTNNPPKTGGNSSTPPPSQSPPLVDEVAMSKELYATNCIICHKDTGKGGKVTIEGKSINPEDLTKEKFKNATDAKLIGYITDGIEDEGMPAFKGKLSSDQIKSVVRHLRTLQQ